MNQLTTQPVAVDSDLAGKILTCIIPALECAGFQIADASVSDHGLVLNVPDHGYLEVAFNMLPEGPDAPDADWSDPRWDDPARWTTEAPYDPSAADWEEYHEMFDRIESDGEDYLTAFNRLRDDSSESPA
jgi:hypothetical protein